MSKSMNDHKVIKATFKRRGTTKSYELTKLVGAATLTIEEPGQEEEEIRVKDRIKEGQVKLLAERPSLEVTVS